MLLFFYKVFCGRNESDVLYRNKKYSILRLSQPIRGYEKKVKNYRDKKFLFDTEQSSR